MFGGALLMALFAIVVFVFSFTHASIFANWENILKKKLTRRTSLAIVSIVLGFITWSTVELSIYAGVTQEPVTQAILMRLRPLLIGASVIAVELEALILIWYWRENGSRPWKSRYLPGVILLWGILLSFTFIQPLHKYRYANTGSDNGVFRSLGAPILDVQIYLVVLLVLVVGIWTWKKVKPQMGGNTFLTKYSDIILSIVLWGIAFGVWMVAPLKGNWFVDVPRPPEYTFSPNSDAFLYEAVGQGLLVGAGLHHPQWGAMVLRPMYSAILALFHAIAGLRYVDIIWLQVASLAFFPVLVYNLTTRLHHRLSGVIAALLVICKEYNALLLADTITVSHAKLLMADLPATLGVVLVILLFVRWLQSPKNSFLPLVAGGAIGFFLLVRMEAAVLLMLIVISGLVLIPKKTELWLRGSGLVVVGFVLMVSPWVWRNWQQTGQVYLVAPKYEKYVIYKLFGFSDYPESTVPDVGVGGGAFASLSSSQNAMVSSAHETETGWSSRERFLQHVYNSQLQVFQYFPMSPHLLISTTNLLTQRNAGNFLETCCSPESYVRSLPYWWPEWDGTIMPESTISMGVILLISSIGIFGLWRQQGALGLLPMIFSIVYFGFLAFIERSGGRWIIEVDWISTVVVSVGMVELYAGFRNWSAGREIIHIQTNVIDKQSVPPSWKTFLTFGVILILGLALPLSEMLIPQRYTQEDIDAHLSRFLSAEAGVMSEDDQEQLTALLAHDDLELFYGRALYPRFYKANDGMVGIGGMYIRPFPRMEFFIVGTMNNFTFLPYPDVVQINFADDVFVIGRRGPESSYLELFGVIVFSDDGITPRHVLWSDQIGDS